LQPRDHFPIPGFRDWKTVRDPGIAIIRRKKLVQGSHSQGRDGAANSYTEQSFPNYNVLLVW